MDGEAEQAAADQPDDDGERVEPFGERGGVRDGAEAFRVGGGAGAGLDRRRGPLRTEVLDQRRGDEAQRQAAESQRSALDADIGQLQAAIRVEVAEAQASIRTAISLAELAQSGVTASEASRQVRVARYEAGRATVDEVLDAEAAYARQRAQAATAGYRLLTALIAYRLATGASLFEDLSL